MAKPNLTYSYFSYGIMSSTGTATTKTLDHLPTSEDDPVRVSFQNGFNLITIKYTPDCPLQYFEVRITGKDDDYGIGVGTKWLSSGPNIAGNTEETIALDVNSTYFPTPQGKSEPDGVYRIGLYAKAADSQGLWDVTYLYISYDDYIVAPSDFDGIEVLTDEPIPES